MISIANPMLVYHLLRVPKPDVTAGLNPAMGTQGCPVNTFGLAGTMPKSHHYQQSA